MNSISISFSKRKQEYKANFPNSNTLLSESKAWMMVEVTKRHMIRQHFKQGLDCNPLKLAP